MRTLVCVCGGGGGIRVHRVARVQHSPLILGNYTERKLLSCVRLVRELLDVCEVSLRRQEQRKIDMYASVVFARIHVAEEIYRGSFQENLFGDKGCLPTVNSYFNSHI